MTRTRMIGLIVLLALASGAQSAAAHAYVDLYCYSNCHDNTKADVQDERP